MPVKKKKSYAKSSVQTIEVDGQRIHMETLNKIIHDTRYNAEMFVSFTPGINKHHVEKLADKIVDVINGQLAMENITALSWVLQKCAEQMRNDAMVGGLKHMLHDLEQKLSHKERNSPAVKKLIHRLKEAEDEGGKIIDGN